MSAFNTNYTSRPVTLPPDFLASPPPAPVSINHISWKETPIPEYSDCVALTIPSALSPSECGTLIKLAESSVPEEEAASPWRPALVSSWNGAEARAPGYRESGRIVWDSQEVVDLIWARCRHAAGLEELLKVAPQKSWGGKAGRWEFRRFNDRMRFLRYEPGQFFKPHRDGAFFYEKDGKEFETQFTVQLYLSDSAAVSETGEGCVGGATRFISPDRTRGLNVDPRAGSVLIFQHEGLLHEGAKVESGVKYAVRMDIIYEWVADKSG